MKQKWSDKLLIIQTIIDIWIHEEDLGNYDKIPKMKDYDKLARALADKVVVMRGKTR